MPVLKNNYRLRVKGHETNFLFTVNHDAEKKDLKVDLNSKNESSLLLGPQSVLSFTNNSDENVILTIEQLKVADYALRPQHVLMFPEFKDLTAQFPIDSEWVSERYKPRRNEANKNKFEKYMFAFKKALNGVFREIR